MNNEQSAEKKRALTKTAIERLFEGLANVKTKAETEKVLRDLFSPEEIRDIARRLQAYEMLTEKMTYQDIQESTEMSPPTIQKVNSKRKHGYGGYKLLYDLLHKDGKPYYRK
jgi:TrpR-related protein YerC/YecD